MIREIDDANIKPKGKAKKRETKENIYDSGIGESFNVIIEILKLFLKVTFDCMGRCIYLNMSYE